MAKAPNPEIIDDDNPELSGDDMARMRPAAEMLPRQMYDELVAHQAKRRPGQRGPGKRSPKVAVSLRLDPDTLATIKASGPGWQVRVNEILTTEATSGRFAPQARAATTLRKADKPLKRA